VITVILIIAFKTQHIISPFRTTNLLSWTRATKEWEKRKPKKGYLWAV